MAVGDAEDAYMEKALELVHSAGLYVLEVFHKKRDAMDATERRTEAEVVTEVDKKVEALMTEKLQFHFPTHEVIGEETVRATDSTKVDWDEATPTWIIDPLNGSTNFAHRLPFVSICLALTHHKEVRIGIVYNPISGDLYTARKGKGAFKNRFRLKTSHTAELGKALVMGSEGRHVVGSIEKKKVAAIYMHNVGVLWDAAVRGVRWVDNASLSMCFVAEGAADLFLDYGLFCWNMAAPMLIVTEAGGVATDTKAQGRHLRSHGPPHPRRRLARTRRRRRRPQLHPHRLSFPSHQVTTHQSHNHFANHSFAIHASFVALFIRWKVKAIVSEY